MGFLDAFLGGAGDYSPDNRTNNALLLRAIQNKEVQKRLEVEQTQKIRDANLRIYQNDAIRGFEFTNAEIQKDFHKNMIKPAMEQWTKVYANANQEGRRITAEEIGNIKMQQEAFKNKKAQADEWIANMNKASKIIEEDKYGVYSQGYGADVIGTIPRLDNGDIDWENFDPKSPLKSVGSPENMNLDGLVKKFYDTLEEGAMTEISTEWEAGELWDKENTIKFKGSVELKEDGKPRRTEDGRIVPKVDNDTMGLVKDTMPDLYSKLESESQATGRGMQEILRDKLIGVGGVKEDASRTKVSRTDPSGSGEKKTAAESKADDRFDMIRGIVGFGREPDESMVGAIKQAFGGPIEDAKIIEAPGGKAPKVSNRPPAPGEDPMEDRSADKILKITYFETVEGQYETTRVRKTATLPLHELTDSKESILKLNNLIGKITGFKIPAEALVKRIEEFTKADEGSTGKLDHFFEQ